MARHFDVEERHRHEVLSRDHVAVSDGVSTAGKGVEYSSGELGPGVVVLADLPNTDRIEELGHVTCEAQSVAIRHRPKRDTTRAAHPVARSSK